MNGHVLKELPVAVDCFTSKISVQLYFLTHAHADHTIGLTDSWGKNLYCTAATGRAVNFRLGVNKKFIVPLEELQPHVFKLRAVKDWVYLTVTVIPANHCPGSCMFLFETENIRILYTGDFRPNEKIYEIGKNLWGPLHHTVDVLYLDNTYCEPACVFPPKKDTVKEIVNLCKCNEDCTIFIGINWTGHEELLEEIALELEQYIVVSHAQLELLRILEMKGVFSTDKNSSNIHVMPSHLVKNEHLRKINETEDCIGILPTAKFCHKQHTTMNGEFITTVPYSNHSSFSELWEFVKSVQPVRIKPIVPGRTELQGMESNFRADMSQFDCLLRPRFPAKLSPQKFVFSYLGAGATSESSDCHGNRKRKRKQRIPFKRKLQRKKPCGVVFEEDA